jgi:hypothetical protein
MNLCKYKNIFGIPKQGVHSYRIFNIAIVDVIMTILVGYIISCIYKTPFIMTCIILFILGIILHRIFCVRTTVDKLLFSSNDN